MRGLPPSHTPPFASVTVYNAIWEKRVHKARRKAVLCTVHTGYGRIKQIKSIGFYDIFFELELNKRWQVIIFIRFYTVIIFGTHTLVVKIYQTASALTTTCDLYLDLMTLDTLTMQGVSVIDLFLIS